METTDAWRLFAVYLGGRAPKCMTELHDLVFVVGKTIESSYEQLMDKWFGDPRTIHIDAWLELDIVDGYRVRLLPERSQQAERLWFINLGAYRPGELTELHKIAILVDTDANEVKRRAKATLLTDAVTVHKDDLYDVDDCLELTEINDLYVHLEPSTERSSKDVVIGYHVIPKAILEAYAKRQA